MRLQDALSIGDLERLAQKRLPRVLFECIGSGVEDEQGVIRNETAFHKHQLLARHLVDVSNRDQSTTIFGRTYASPFGISPTGIAEIFRRGADSMLAQAAAAAKVPSIISGSCMTPPETIAQVSGGNAWFQLYAARDPNISDDFVRRARDAGYSTMVLTVDNPVFPKMERDKRNGFSVPFRLTVPLLIDALMHPRWTAEFIAALMAARE